MGRTHATISRELKRNGPFIPTWVYWHQGAHQQAMQRRKQPCHFRRHAHKPLLRCVESKLRDDWSPEVITAKLVQDYPDNTKMRVSIETVYRWVYRDAGQGEQLFICLCRYHKKRRTQRRYGTGRGLIPGRVSIHLRPDLVATRQRYGDWEGATVEGAKGSGYITTYVELKSRYLIAAKLANNTAAKTAKVAAGAYRRIPKKLPHILTLDNGKKFARFKEKVIVGIMQ